MGIKANTELHKRQSRRSVGTVFFLTGVCITLTGFLTDDPDEVFALALPMLLIGLGIWFAYSSLPLRKVDKQAISEATVVPDWLYFTCWILLAVTIPGAAGRVSELDMLSGFWLLSGPGMMLALIVGVIGCASEKNRQSKKRALALVGAASFALVAYYILLMVAFLISWN